ncbi:hypothetical protein [Bordetella sp. 2513F-2]
MARRYADLFAWKEADPGIPAAAHGLPGRLVVSLTSYRKRFRILPRTLACLLNQSVQPDRIILWIAQEERALLPESVRSLEGQGLEIRYCADIKSYKKIIPTLEEEPSAFIVTADDDVRYPSHWLAGLIAAWPGDYRTAVAWRAHRIALDPATGRPLPYFKWRWSYRSSTASSTLIFPTGVGGVLYPPGIFHADVTNRALFESLCPNADDVWLYWMWRRNGGRARVVGERLALRQWPGSQYASLWHKNLFLGNNDQCIKNMVGHYGLFGRSARRVRAAALSQADSVG